MNRMRPVPSALLLAILVSVSGCGRSVQQAEPSLFQDIVSAYTAGPVSSESAIRVRFVEDIVPGDRVQVPLERSPFSFDPRISGVAVWADSRTIEFRPRNRLPRGTSYAATLDLSALCSVERGRELFPFRFTTLEQSFEISFQGLESIAGRPPEHQQLGGEIVTADTEAGPDIRKMLRASHHGKDLPVSWVHNDGGRRHAFLVEGITRGPEPTVVAVEWNGVPIGVDKKGRQDVPVPALGTFAVLGTAAVAGEEACIEVRFSDPVDPAQDLRGLIAAGERTGLRYGMAENVVRVYSPEPWDGTVAVTVRPGIRNAAGKRLAEGTVSEVSFEESLPQVRFAGRGVILPTSQGLTIPIETNNLRAVIVRATRVYDKNIPQFLQVNELEGERELDRVGRTVWEKTIPLGFTPDQRNRWIRHGLDVSSLVEGDPDGLYRLQVYFRRPHVVYQCRDSAPGAGREAPEEALADWDQEQESSYWDTYGPGRNWREHFENRRNPCHPGYYWDYYDHSINAYRNFLVSDLGLIAKRGGDGSFFAAVTDLKTTGPVAGAEITLLDYQQQVLARSGTAADGTARMATERAPFLLVAQSRGRYGYLRLDDGQSLSVSQFDVSGAAVEGGMKGFIYGERGVWRPGDPIHLTFILLDTETTLPGDYPVRLELRNPRGQLVDTVNRKNPVNGFYTFRLRTDPDAPTGNWNVRIRAGGAEFTKLLKIETVMPNRLKIALDFGKGVRSLKGGRIEGDLSAAWLHGAPARDLKAAMELTLTADQTRFPKYGEYSFDDPARTFKPESHTVFDGTLDAAGRARFSSGIQVGGVSPGMLRADFTTRVFEPGGASSMDRVSLPYHPFDRYIGILAPPGDKERGMLLTDTRHPVRLVAVDNEGAPVAGSRVRVEVYKVKWRWWWEKGGESMAEYLGTPEYRPIQSGTVELADGTGVWDFEIKQPEWGRYLIRVSDLEGRHSSGRTVYVDWPGWAGRGRSDSPGGATVLSFSSDKEEYRVGETVVLSIPAGQKGRGLVSLENGTRMLGSSWIETGEETVRYTFTATPEMAPNIYAHVTLLQPHLQTHNDLPIRLYGVVPIRVQDPGTRLEPVVGAPAEFQPDHPGTLTVREKNGRPMTYTVAVVDEGLLDLTRFATPDPWEHFYRREALGVRTWDLFDLVAGAYGGTLERMLAVGGGADAGPVGQKKADRFPPLVRFLGPFELGAGRENTHRIEIPQYVGSVRVMVTAGQGRAFGHADRSVFVRSPLMILGTLPRVLGPGEEVELPVSVFALGEKVREAAVDIAVEGPAEVVGPRSRKIAFDHPGEGLVAFRLRTQTRTGMVRVTLAAAGAGERARQTIELDIRMPSYRETLVADAALNPGRTWRQEAAFTGMEGTNEAWLEVSRIPPLDLARRLDFLIRYPHGCVEQVASAVFPQLYLSRLLELGTEREDEIQANVNAAIGRLQRYQLPGGGFAYWPGADEAHDWASSYVGHFFVEAGKAGYRIPGGVLGQWQKYQRGKALSWTRREPRSGLHQAYRLYTLALAGSPELGAMNRLKEMPGLEDEARWRLAAAFQMAGQPEAALELVEGASREVPEYRELSHTFGSTLRDKAMVLETLGIMDMVDEALPLAGEVSGMLGGDQWHSTHATAFALIALARLTVAREGEMALAYSWRGGGRESLRSALPVVQIPLPAPAGEAAVLELENSGTVTLYARLIRQGVPPPGAEKASRSRLDLKIRYRTLDNRELDPSELEQGLEFIIAVEVANTGYQGEYREVALTHMVPSGWEIRNLRMAPTGRFQDSGFDYQDIRDDRVYTYFSIGQGERKTFHMLANASYLGRFYLPPVGAEAMYDATINARVPGRWITVERPGAAP